MAFKSTLSSQNQPAVHAGWFGACNPVYNGVRFQFWPVATKLRVATNGCRKSQGCPSDRHAVAIGKNFRHLKIATVAKTPKASSKHWLQGISTLYCRSPRRSCNAARTYYCRGHINTGF